MCRSPPATPTRAPPCATTAPERSSTATPTTSWPPTWHPVRSRGSRPCRRADAPHRLVGTSWAADVESRAMWVGRWRRSTTPHHSAGGRGVRMGAGSAPDRWADAAVALERHAEGEGVLVPDLAGDRGDGHLGVAEQVRRQCHPPAGEVGERWLADQVAEACGEGGAGHIDLGGQLGDRPPVSGCLV